MQAFLDGVAVEILVLFQNGGLVGRENDVGLFRKFHGDGFVRLDRIFALRFGFCLFRLCLSFDDRRSRHPTERERLAGRVLLLRNNLFLQHVLFLRERFLLGTTVFFHLFPHHEGTSGRHSSTLQFVVTRTRTGRRHFDVAVILRKHPRFHCWRSGSCGLYPVFLHVLHRDVLLGLWLYRSGLALSFRRDGHTFLYFHLLDRLVRGVGRLFDHVRLRRFRRHERTFLRSFCFHLLVVDSGLLLDLVPDEPGRQFLAWRPRLRRLLRRPHGRRVDLVDRRRGARHRGVAGCADGDRLLSESRRTGFLHRGGGRGGFFFHFLFQFVADFLVFLRDDLWLECIRQPDLVRDWFFGQHALCVLDFLVGRNLGSFSDFDLALSSSFNRCRLHDRSDHLRSRFDHNVRLFFPFLHLDIFGSFFFLERRVFHRRRLHLHVLENLLPFFTSDLLLRLLFSHDSFHDVVRHAQFLDYILGVLFPRPALVG
mmetsp:Transcript_26942/g.67866  ORF Transcript_26942/g.67866 Transcript_26942/m.67866 type:complete len:481 (-) Transcript_26942:520-1962(-)